MFKPEGGVKVNHEVHIQHYFETEHLAAWIESHRNITAFGKTIRFSAIVVMMNDAKRWNKIKLPNREPFGGPNPSRIYEVVEEDDCFVVKTTEPAEYRVKKDWRPFSYCPFRRV